VATSGWWWIREPRMVRKIWATDKRTSLFSSQRRSKKWERCVESVVDKEESEDGDKESGESLKKEFNTEAEASEARRKRRLEVRERKSSLTNRNDECGEKWRRFSNKLKITGSELSSRTGDTTGNITEADAGETSVESKEERAS